VPRVIASELLAAGVAQAAISVIPDEQEAIDAALAMGRSGDLVLIFADALTRSWKQIIRFRPEGAPATAARMQEPAAPAPVIEAPAEAPVPLSLEGLIRDERGIRYAPEVSD
jgi:cyanophycin synthetase